jgi:outer membrane autotransporter protein
MNQFRLFILLFAVLPCCGITYNGDTAAAESAPSEPEFIPPAIFPSPTIFSAELLPNEYDSTGFYPADLYLGQKKRRRGSGGRAWANLYYADTTLHPRDTAKISPDTYGVQVGFDAVKQHGIYSTFFANIQQSEIACQGADSKIENYMFGYGKYAFLKASHFGFLASAGYDEYKVHTAGEKLGGSGMQAMLFGEAGIDILLGQWALKPFYDLQYGFLYHGRIGEADSPEKIHDQHGHSFAQLLGMRTNWKPADRLEFQLRTTWVHEYLNEPPPFYNLRFSAVQGTMTPAVMFFEGYTGRDWAWLGLGMKFECDFNVYLFLDYDVMINAYHTSHLVNLGFCLGW